MLLDDMVLIDEIKVNENKKLELWKSTLESKGFRLTRTKTEYMHCNLSDAKDRRLVSLNGVEMLKGDPFWYNRTCLGSIMQKEGMIEKDISHRIKAR